MAMDRQHPDLTLASPQPPILDQRQDAGWDARIALGFTKSEKNTVLSRREHQGPLRVQKPLYPEANGICHTILLHPPGGIVAGDHLHIAIELETLSHALITTPGASKWYRSPGPLAVQQLTIHVREGGVLEWLPQESIVFDQAKVDIHNQITLAAHAVYFGWDLFCLGRRASGEGFTRGTLNFLTRIERDGKPLWMERALLQGGSRLLTSPAGLDEYSVHATFVAVSDKMDAELLARCRLIQPSEENTLHGLTLLPSVLIARYLGHSAQAARHWMTRIWQTLRPPLTGYAATIPRIWST